jgi:hypothetical protein
VNLDAFALLWIQRKAETGDGQIKPRATSSQKQKITDPCGICFAAWNKLRAFAKGQRCCIASKLLLSS